MAPSELSYPEIEEETKPCSGSSYTTTIKKKFLEDCTKLAEDKKPITFKKTYYPPAVLIQVVDAVSRAKAREEPYEIQFSEEDEGHVLKNELKRPVLASYGEIVVKCDTPVARNEAEDIANRFQKISRKDPETATEEEDESKYWLKLSPKEDFSEVDLDEELNDIRRGIREMLECLETFLSDLDGVKSRDESCKRELDQMDEKIDVAWVVITRCGKDRVDELEHLLSGLEQEELEETEGALLPSSSELMHYMACAKILERAADKIVVIGNILDQITEGGIEPERVQDVFTDVSEFVGEDIKDLLEEVCELVKMRSYDPKTGGISEEFGKKGENIDGKRTEIKNGIKRLAEKDLHPLFGRGEMEELDFVSRKYGKIVQKLRDIAGNTFSIQRWKTSV